MNDSIEVSVDKATFLEVGRVFQRVYRPSGAANVILTLADGRLRIAFYNGGSELACESPVCLTAKMTVKAFASIVTAYRYDKDLTGKIELTFRPELGQFATRIAGAKAKIHLLDKAN